MNTVNALTKIAKSALSGEKVSAVKAITIINGEFPRKREDANKALNVIRRHGFNDVTDITKSVLSPHKEIVRVEKAPFNFVMYANGEIRVSSMGKFKDSPSEKLICEALKKIGITKNQLRLRKMVISRALKMKEVKSNPPRGAVLIYDNILSIEAEKGKDSLWPGELFRHDFKAKKGKAAIYGLPDGSLLIKGTKKLWKKFQY